MRIIKNGSTTEQKESKIRVTTRAIIFSAPPLFPKALVRVDEDIDKTLRETPINTNFMPMRIDLISDPTVIAAVETMI